jgi:hypothetical protein
MPADSAKIVSDYIHQPGKFQKWIYIFEIIADEIIVT